MKKGALTCLVIVLIFVVLVVIGVLVMFLAKICPPNGPWPMPPWCSSDAELEKQGNSDLPCPPPGPWGAPPWCENVEEKEFVYLDEQKKTDLLNNPTFWAVPSHNIFEFQQELQTLHPDAVGWAAIDKYHTDLEGIAIQQMLHTYQLESTLLVSSYLGLGDSKGVTPSLNDPQLSIQGLDNQAIAWEAFYKTVGSDSNRTEQFWYNFMNPDYQRYMLEWGQNNIDMSSNGFVIDNLPISSIIYKGSGSFDTYSMQGFRNYLSKKYSSDELLEKYSIQNIGDFDLSEYIQTNNLEKTWNQSSYADKVHPLIYEFNVFLADMANDYLITYQNTMRQYAAEKNDRSLLFTVNSSPLWDWMTWNKVDYLDYLSGEHFWFGRGFNKAAVAVTLAQDLTSSGKFVILAEVDHHHVQIPSETKNLFKYMFADTYSIRGGSLMSDSARFFTMLDGAYYDWDNWVKYDLTEAGRYIRFMQDHRNLYLKEAQASVGVIHSIASRHGDNMPIKGMFSEGNNITQLIEMLFNLNVPFELVVSGNDGAFTQEFTIKDLNDFEVVILPSVYMISENETQALYDYVSNGGVVLQLRQFATLDKQGQMFEQSKFVGISDQEGVHIIGEGKWHTMLDFVLAGYTWNDDKGMSLMPNEFSFENLTLQQLKSVLNETIDFEIETDAPITVNIHKYTDGERIVLHIVNYDFDPSADRFFVPEPFEVRARTTDMTINHAILYDFETGNETEIEFISSGEDVTFTVPNLYAYSIVELLP